MLESATPQAVGERLLALVKPTPKSQRVVRRAWRSAQRLQAELDILWVSQHEPDADERDQLEALRRLATLLGAHLLVGPRRRRRRDRPAGRRRPRHAPTC